MCDVIHVRFPSSQEKKTVFLNTSLLRYTPAKKPLLSYSLTPPALARHEVPFNGPDSRLYG